MAFGTLSVLDTLAALNATSVIQYGEDEVFRVIQEALDAHNALINDMVPDLVERTTDRLRPASDASTMDMEEIDEFARPNVQKVAPSQVNYGFPMRLYGAGLQWTRKYLQNATPAQIAKQVSAMLDGDLRVTIRELKRAVFRPTNFTFTDRLMDGLAIPVKAFLNADGFPIPNGPNNTVFDPATHTHYLATASMTAANVSALIDTETEHLLTGEPRVYINQAQEAALRGFTANFTPYYDPRVAQSATTVTVNGKTLDIRNTGNRAIGIFDEAEVWVKPWIPASYLFSTVIGGAPPIAWRTRAGGGGQLELVADNEDHPLRARSYEREFGMSVAARVNGAVLYTGGGSYVNPTIT